MNGVTALSSEIELGTTSAAPDEVVAWVADAVRDAGSSARTLETIIAPLLHETPKPPELTEVRTYGPAAGGAPHVSIIIPFSRDASFLRDHLVAQRRAPPHLEWIFVCDDLDLAGTLCRTLDRHRSLAQQPTSLLLLSRSGGYAHAINLGAARARGDYLLLMNSDVICDDFAFIDRAVAQMEADARIGATGFSLRFEDGTVRHDGMTLRPAPWFDDLWASEYPGKGLPPQPAIGGRTEVEAVTAALMLLRRADFPDGHVFDAGYFIGDFEDADLCMRLKDQGRAIALVHCDGLWHLERQPAWLLHAGDTEIRQAVTRIDGLRFNRRWDDALGEPAGERS